MQAYLPFPGWLCAYPQLLKRAYAVPVPQQLAADPLDRLSATTSELPSQAQVVPIRVDDEFFLNLGMTARIPGP